MKLAAAAKSKKELQEKPPFANSNKIQIKFKQTKFQEKRRFANSLFTIMPNFLTML